MRLVIWDVIVPIMTSSQCREATNYRYYIFEAVKLCLEWIFKGGFLVYELLTLLFSCGTDVIELFNNSNNNSGISEGFVMFLTGIHDFLYKRFWVS